MNPEAQNDPKLARFDKSFQSHLRKRTKEYCAEEMERAQKLIKVFTAGAWTFVALGFAAAACGVPAMLKELPWYSLKNLGDYGSYLQGSVASLWALSGVMFIYATLLAQRMQLLQQAADLQDQQEQFQLQQDSIQRQNFEGAFFQLLNLHNQLRQDLKEAHYHGRLLFEHWHSTFASEFDQWYRRKTNGQQLNDALSADRDLAVSFFVDFYRDHESQMGPFFRNLYHIFKFVKTSAPEPKRRYTSLARAQLSKFELLFLFYDCMTPYGAGFKPLVEEFGLLEHLEKGTLLHKTHETFFAPTAYQ